MTANQSVPPTVSAATGTVSVVSVNQNDGGYAVTLAGAVSGFGADTATLAHIHGAIAGLEGPILDANNYTVVTAAGIVTVSGTQTLSQASMAEVVAGRTYVNIHTSMFGMGAVRGQILRVGEILWSAQLSGANEVPPSTAGLVGGVGFILHTDGGVSYEGAWPASVEAVASHIHVGAAGIIGPVVLPLTLVGTTGITGSFVTQQADAGADQYVNVHTTDAGDGLIRGQIVVH